MLCGTRSVNSNHFFVRTLTHTHPKIRASLAAYSAPDRLKWIVEPKSRYAAEKADSHACPRLAAALVTHLKAFLADLPTHDQLADTVSHGLDTWEPLMERHVSSLGAGARHPLVDATSALAALVMRARYA